ncbi:flavodoxin family protein [Maritalea myrionectae]|uniref:NAD(P)H dehydrogenase (Quinone) n=1 Tax=Maritalea myrionectae TaxID=454601 RepID=A0A2R4MAE2_9HYPH|nr:flavodoxin family protein [Maritalea myrionectae]AVX02914.1 NAD(P)H dehydrogenase (quinone) [Maritalea myrionectae]
MTKVAIVFHSGYGHTAKQAEAVRNGVARTNANPILIPVEEADNHWDDLKDADAIIFGSPTYMGSVSGEFKAFADKSSKVWFEQGWKDKVAAGFTNSSSLNGDKHSTLQQLSLLAAQHGMHWVSLGLMPGNNSSTGSEEDLNRLGASLGAMAQSNADQGPEHGPIPSDLETAAHLGERVATIARQFAAAKKIAA